MPTTVSMFVILLALAATLLLLARRYNWLPAVSALKQLTSGLQGRFRRSQHV